MSKDWYKQFINVIENPVKKDEETPEPEKDTGGTITSSKGHPTRHFHPDVIADTTPDDEATPFTRSGKGESDEAKDPILFHRTMNKLVILGKSGMLDHDTIMKLRQSFKVMLDGKVPSSQQRAVLLTVLDKLITLITSDMSLFNRIRSDLQRDKNTSKK